MRTRHYRFEHHSEHGAPPEVSIGDGVGGASGKLEVHVPTTMSKSEALTQLQALVAAIRQEHRNATDELVAKAEAVVASKLGYACPHCGEGRLTERSGKYGAFVGCSAYPRCRYTEPAAREPVKAQPPEHASQLNDG